MGREIRETLGVAEAETDTALMPDEIEIYRSAKLLIDQHGEDAPIFAAKQADKCLEAGDLDGKAVWMGVIRAIEELQDQRPPTAGQPVH